jgi:hypothetical protein
VCQNEAVLTEEPLGPGLVHAVRDLGLTDDPAEIPIFTRERLAVDGKRDLRKVLADPLQAIAIELQTGVDEQWATKRRRPVAVFDVLLAVDNQPRPRMSDAQCLYRFPAFMPKWTEDILAVESAASFALMN